MAYNWKTMKLSRPSRFVAALIALCSMLFVQLALASYTCPMLTPPAAMGQAMVDCAGMDMEQPAMCGTHAHSGHQSLDKPEIPQVQPFMATSLTVTLASAILALDPAQDPPTAALLKRSTAPPLIIRHCCFRI